MRVTIDIDSVRQLESDLKTFASRAYPYATRETVNRAAFKTRKAYQLQMRSKMTLRNRWAVGSVRVERARTLIVRQQEASVGSVADFMATQEFGGMVRGERGSYKPIPTSYSAGQGMRQRPRTRLPRKPNKLRNISLRNRRTAGASRKARNRAAVLEAAQSGQKVIYLDLGRKRGLFRIVGGKRKPRVRMLYDLSRRSVSVPRNPMLRPATERTAKRLPAIHATALRQQLRRHKVLGYR